MTNNKQVRGLILRPNIVTETIVGHGCKISISYFGYLSSDALIFLKEYAALRINCMKKMQANNTLTG